MMAKMSNGKMVPVPQQLQLPFAQVVADPSKVSEKNPNGVVVVTNVASNVPGSKLMVIRLLAEGIEQMVDAARADGAGQFAASVVMPDGSPAPMPVVTDPQG